MMAHVIVKHGWQRFRLCVVLELGEGRMGNVWGKDGGGGGKAGGTRKLAHILLPLLFLLAQRVVRRSSAPLQKGWVGGWVGCERGRSTL